MKAIIVIGLLCYSITGMCNESLETRHKSRAHHAPKRLDTTPNKTSEDAWTLGLESNTYATDTYLNPTLDYSAAGGWDFSIASYGVKTQKAQSSDYNLFLGISKTIDVTDGLSVLIGTQIGTNLFGNTHPIQGIGFANIVYDITEWLTVYSGMYYANREMSHIANEIGIMSGMTFKLIPGTLHLQADYIGGHSAVSGAEVNLQYSITETVQGYIGVIVPEKNSGNEFAGVVGFNISTKDIMD